MKHRFPLHIHISTLFLSLILLVGGIIASLGYQASRSILAATVTEFSLRLSEDTLQEFTKVIAPAEMATRLLSFDGVSQGKSLEERLGYLPFLREALVNSPALTSIYVGYANGDFFLLRRIQNDVERAFFKAPAQTTYIVQSIDRPGDTARGRYLFLDRQLVTLGSEEHADYPDTYDPRQRDWYKAAMASPGQIKTEPYLFFTSRQIGTTIANHAHRGGAVMGADIQLATLDQVLAKQKATPGTHVVLANQRGEIIASEQGRLPPPTPAADGKPRLAILADLGIPVLAELSKSLPGIRDLAPRQQTLNVAGEDWHSFIHPVLLEGSPPLYLITATPDQELMASSRTLLHHSLITMALVILLAIPIAWAMARSVSRPLRQLADEAEAIRHFEFNRPIQIESQVREVHDLTSTMDSMKRTIRRFLDINMAVAAENNFDRLLPQLLGETMSAAEAEAGILYLADQEQLLATTALAANGEALAIDQQPLASEHTGPLLSGALASRAAQAAPLGEADITALRLDEIIRNTGATQAIAVPLLNRQQNLVGAMLLLRRQPTDAAQLSFIEALSGSAALTLENKELIHAQKRLFEALVQLIAGAIDAKSAYTGGHCARVPELTKLLAQAACAETQGSYKDFQLDDEEWEALHVAAWLHDCGKVTTPEYVVDKATKLETIYDRIHEIRMRFEVLKRDAEIACLKSIVAGQPADLARQTLTEAQHQLDEDYAFIAHCNEGGENLAPEAIERLRQIALRTWQRTLDDRIGLSEEEKRRKAGSPAPALPAEEPLLADKPEHIFERQPADRIPADNPWGFAMTVPEHLYNKGELHNLAVARGTLSEEERYKINEHIVQTLMMLSRLPFPKHLRKVPEIAGCHHEKMDGTGYPRRLHRDEMMPVARMMAIADIFEALTADDRPYKKGKTLSESIAIMARMKSEQHIDGELFDLFLRSGSYLEYARRFMKPTQIDEVDISRHLH